MVGVGRSELKSKGRSHLRPAFRLRKLQALAASWSDDEHLWPNSVRQPGSHSTTAKTSITKALVSYATAQPDSTPARILDRFRNECASTEIDDSHRLAPKSASWLARPYFNFDMIRRTALPGQREDASNPMRPDLSLEMEIAPSNVN